MYQRPPGPSNIVVWPRDHHCSLSFCVRTIELCGQFSQGPFTDRDRAANQHMAGRRTGGATDRANEVEPVAPPRQFRSFQRIGLCHPVVGIKPTVVNILDRASRRQSVARQFHAVYAGQEQIAFAILAHQMPGSINVLMSMSTGSLHGPCMLSA